MGASIKTRPELVRPAGSHSLTLDKYGNAGAVAEPFEREELFPVLELEAPRVGRVRAQFEANRYVHSEGWSEWRIFLRDVRRPDPERPAIGGDLAAGVGPSTREAITEACRPLIVEWLEGDEYAESRRVAAARAIVRELEAPRDHWIDRVRQDLERAVTAGAIGSDVDIEIRRALELLEQAGALLEEVTS